MKKIVLLIAIVCSAAIVNAAERSKEVLKEIALNVLMNENTAKGWQSSDALLDVAYLNEEIAIVSKQGGQSVIMAIDDTHEPVLAYTDGTFDVKNINPAMQWWIESTTKALNNDEYTATLSKMPEGLPQSQTHFITTHWAQSAPYNNLCPSYTKNGSVKHYPSGCVATAMAQVMNYYKYPNKGTGSCVYMFNPGDGSSTIIRMTLDEHPFNWNAMLDNYTTGNYTEEQANAVALLMQVCGASVEMEYTESGSGAMMYDACYALRNNFAYDRGMPIFWRDFVTEYEFNYHIYKGLAQKMPVLFGGISSSGGHAFILDGYDAEGKVHVNWGWGLNGGDGYFELRHMNAFEQQQQYIVVTNSGVNPVYKSMFGLYQGGLDIGKVDDTHIYINTAIPFNLDAETYKGDLYFVAENTITKEVSLLATQKLSAPVTIYGFALEAGISKPFVKTEGKVTDGTYAVYMASKATGEVAYSPVRTYDNYKNRYFMTIKNGIIASIEVDKDNSWTATTGIVTTVMEESDNNAAYSVSGQRVDSSYRGIVIKNGKKYIVK